MMRGSRGARAACPLQSQRFDPLAQPQAVAAAGRKLQVPSSIAAVQVATSKFFKLSGFCPHLQGARLFSNFIVAGEGREPGWSSSLSKQAAGSLSKQAAGSLSKQAAGRLSTPKGPQVVTRESNGHPVAREGEDAGGARAAFRRRTRHVDLGLYGGDRYRQSFDFLSAGGRYRPLTKAGEQVSAVRPA